MLSNYASRSIEQMLGRHWAGNADVINHKRHLAVTFISKLVELVKHFLVSQKNDVTTYGAACRQVILVTAKFSQVPSYVSRTLEHLME